jgi:signal transduction histidine kinase
MKGKCEINQVCASLATPQEVLPRLMELLAFLNSRPEVLLRLLAITLWHMEGVSGRWTGDLTESTNNIVYVSRVQAANIEKRELPVKLAGLFPPGAVKIHSDKDISTVEVSGFAAEGLPASRENGREGWRSLNESLIQTLAMVDKLRKSQQLLTEDLLTTDQGVLALIDDTISRLTGGMAHEINNPLAYIKLNAEYVRRAAFRGQNPEASGWTGEMKKALDAVVGGADRIARIIEGLKYYSRQGVGQKESFFLAECVDEAWMIISAQAGGTHCQICVPGDIQIYGDRQQIEQVFINLLSNSIRAIGRAGRAGGEIIIQVTPDLMPDCYASIQVRDNGDGIADKDLNCLFQPFYTTDRVTGIGLGLSIVQGIVIEHGGSIQSATDGDWTVFTVRLPIQ